MHRKTEIKNLITDIINNVPDKFEPLVIKALEFAQRHHQSDTRFSGEPFIIHALNVGRNCANLKLDTNSIITGIIHQTASQRYKTEEVIEMVKEEIKNTFGEDVYKLFTQVQELNDATKMYKQTDFNVLKKYMFSGVKDIRPTIIKICDILDDAQTLEYIPEHKQKGFAEKIFNIYGPLCEYMNMGQVKAIIEEHAFKMVSQEEYTHILDILRQNDISSNLLLEYIEYFKVILDILGYNVEVKGRVKGPYSIFRKLSKYEKEGKGKNINNIRDVLAFSVIVQNEKDCYTISHALQTLCNHDPKHFDDYILIPKPNGYSALHLSIQVPEISHIWAEMQVLTHEMYYTNTYGPASHIAYKAALNRFVSKTTEYNWVEKIHEEITKHTNLRETQREIPINGDVFSNRIFVQTPNGKIIELEQGSTAIDFAYKIHTQIGHSAISAIIDGKSKKLSTQLYTGQTVEIVTQKSKRFPDIQWIDFAVSQSTRNSIREALRKRPV